MRSGRTARLAAAVLVVVAFGPGQLAVAAPPPVTAAPAQVPDDVQLAAREAASRVIGGDNAEYHAKRTGEYDGEFDVVAGNAEQGFAARFAPDGLSRIRSGGTTFAITPKTWGFGGERVPVRAAAGRRVDANEVSYRRGPITEWFVNGPAGLQHGLTVARPPRIDASGPLTVELAVGKRLRLTTTEDADGLTLTAPDGSQLGYRNLRVVDRTGRQLPAWFETTSRGTALVRVVDDNAHYPLTIDPLLQQARLTTTGQVLGEEVGAAVAFDGQTLVVGAPATESGDGAAFVYRPDAQAGWADPVLVATLTTSAATSRLGESVAVNGDAIYVGAPRASQDAGAVYVYQRPPDGWADAGPSATLTVSENASFNRDTELGTTLAVDGGTVVSGAPGADNQEGAAFVFERPDTGWASATQTAKLRNYLPASPLGISVAIDGDTIAVGDASGFVLMFERTTSWIGEELPTAHLPSPQSNDSSFGDAVALNGDTLIVGSPDTGNAYVYQRPATGWRIDAPVQATLTVAGSGADAFGTLAMTEDTLVAGEPDASGEVHVFTRPAEGWTTTDSPAATLGTEDPVRNLGSSVATDGEIVVTGARGTGEGDFVDYPEGTAYVYQRADGGWADATEPARITAREPQPNDQLGMSVDVVGDTVVAGAPGVDGGRGAVYVFEKPADGWANATESAKLIVGPGGSSTPTTALGAAVAFDGQTIVAGAPGTDDEEGAAFVFTRPLGGWVSAEHSGKLINFIEASPLGIAVAVDGPTVVVGDESGFALVYTRPPAGWSPDINRPQAKLQPSPQDLSFGESVAVAGRTVAVGAPAANGNVGAVYVYQEPLTGWTVFPEPVAGLSAPEDGYYNLGTSLAIDADGSTIAAGAPVPEDQGGTSFSSLAAQADEPAGAVRVFSRPAEGWVTTTTPTGTLTTSTPLRSLGHSVAFHEDGAVYAGAPFSGSTGAVHVFHPPPSGWTDTTTNVRRTAMDVAVDDLVGASVATAGDVMAVGAPGYTGADSNRGAVFMLAAEPAPPDPPDPPEEPEEPEEPEVPEPPAPPKTSITTTPAALDFGKTLPLRPTVATVAVVNTGAGTLPGKPAVRIVSAAGRGPTVVDDFVIVRNGCTTALRPQGSCTVDVRYTPSAPGSRTAVLEAEIGGVTRKVALSGSVTGQRLTTNPGVCSAGCVVTVTGRGFPGDRLVELTTPVTTADPIATSLDGSFSTQLLVLPNTRTGTMRVDAAVPETEFGARAGVLVTPGTLGPPDFVMRR